MYAGRAVEASAVGRYPQPSTYSASTWDRLLSPPSLSFLTLLDKEIKGAEQQVSITRGDSLEGSCTSFSSLSLSLFHSFASRIAKTRNVWLVRRAWAFSPFILRLLLTSRIRILNVTSSLPAIKHSRVIVVRLPFFAPFRSFTLAVFCALPLFLYLSSFSSPLRTVVSGTGKNTHQRERSSCCTRKKSDESSLSPGPADEDKLFPDDEYHAACAGR